ncbi:MAG: tRNA (adenosine(37)-N6)-threonylcarbamoyltransferase complex transferase subunit TsaD [Candidatus Paceibacterota bacterium]|jgi:N6-L-threonylcarbamoyladenine synthase
MVILGIETSCDETSIALLKADKTKVGFLNEPMASTVASQIKIHAPYGGVVPMLASREHVKNLQIVFQKTILEAFGYLKNFESNIDLIAVTQGPGLIPALLVGVNFAKTLAWAWKKPIIGVNHLEGHLLSFLLEQKTKNVFPAICLLVSGGHTQLVYIEKIGDYQVIGETRDDAAGECFDKGARILGLGYPGGPAIAQEAKKFKIKNSCLRKQVKFKINIKLPRPMIDSGDHDFSFSGLKTALLYLWQKLSLKERKQLLPALAYELQESITDVLVEKTLSAGKHYKVKSIILGGGVTANLRLREKFNQELNKQNKPFNFYLPLLKYTTDNAMMIASAGFFNYLSRSKKTSSLKWNKIKAEANLRL